jgi:transcriptional regulator of acetoin/glycerol metabolism
VSRELRDLRGEAEENWRVAVEGQGSAKRIRPEVFSSWQRSALSVPVTLREAPLASPEVTQQSFAQSRLGQACQVILDDLRDVTQAGDYVAAITDEMVTITWVAGGRKMLRHADDVHFTLGGCWNEESVGTNALALAHKLERPSTVFSAEHYSPMVHDWVCYSAPILDPTTGHSLGVIDVSSLWSKSNPSVMTMVRALARNVEYELARDDRAEHGTATNSPIPQLRLRFLGDSRVALNARPVKVSPRQSEILCILALYERGLSLDQLTAFLYGDQPISVATVKAEVSHLRSLLGDVISSRPYRLKARVDADHVRVLNALRHGDLVGAVTSYRGSLLAASESPEVATTRHQIDVAIREAVERSGSAELMFQLSNAVPDDPYLATLAAELMKHGDARRGLSISRISSPSS